MTQSRRDAMGIGLALLNRLGGATVVDRLGLRRPVERTVFQATRAGFRTAGAAGRTFSAARRPRRPGLAGEQASTPSGESSQTAAAGTNPTEPARTNPTAVAGTNPTAAAGTNPTAAAGTNPTQIDGRAAAVRPGRPAPGKLFDLAPTDEQRMIVDATREFASRELRAAAAAANEACEAPAGLRRRASQDLGVEALAVPHALGGVASERSAVTSLLVAEALAHGDMGLAVAVLAPAAVSQAIVLWGDSGQQHEYLPPFVGAEPPPAALAVLEPSPLFDPFQLSTTARRIPGGWLLDGVKSLVPLAGKAELFVVAAAVGNDRKPSLFLVESDSSGVSVEAEPSMGLRAAGMGRLVLEGVMLPTAAALGGEAGAANYADCVRLSRLGWAALATGTAQAVLDYVIPYVNDRHAFGEPISHRQAVAFMVADIGIELEGLRLLSRRAAARADLGLPFARDVALARALASEYGMKIGSDGVQLLGGHGFVKEHPVERWYRDLRAIGIMEGGVLL